MKPAAHYWHRYNGISVKEFAKRAGVKPSDVKELIRRRWFRTDGKRPELFDLQPNSHFPQWSIAPAAVERHAWAVKRWKQEEARRQTEAHWKQGVYIIRTEEGPRRYKIGYTSDLPKRANGLRTACPVAIKVLAFIPGKTRKWEWALHRVFARTRVTGEWFDESPALLYLCEKYKYMGPEL